MPRSARRWTSLAARAAPTLILALAAPTAAQQTAAGSPHGDLSIACEACHTPEAWAPLREPLDFAHAATGFALEGAHATPPCASCHADPVFAHVPTACADCHADPHRGELGVECASCHAPVTWENRAAIFELHDRSLFPLTGVHAVTDCEACHRGAPPFEFQATPLDCVACHQAAFEAAEEPDHVAAGFPTDCESCHGTTRWEGAEFDHDGLFFPIESGRHAGVWDDCTDCHVDPRDFGRFECITCHEHNEPEMDDEHEDVPGYVYASQACLECHPNGEE